jgi:hypothetical protein
VIRKVIKGLLTVLVFTFVTRKIAPQILVQLLVVHSSRILINGNTNIDHYECAIAKYGEDHTLVLHEGGWKEDVLLPC